MPMKENIGANEKCLASIPRSITEVQEVKVTKAIGELKLYKAIKELPKGKSGKKGWYIIAINSRKQSGRMSGRPHPCTNVKCLETLGS